MATETGDTSERGGDDEAFQLMPIYLIRHPRHGFAAVISEDGDAFPLVAGSVMHAEQIRQKWAQCEGDAPDDYEVVKFEAAV